MKGLKNLLFYGVFLIVVLIVVSAIVNNYDNQKLKYSELVDYFKNEKVQYFEIEGDVLTFQLVEENGEKPSAQEFTLFSTGRFLDQIQPYVESAMEHGVMENYDVQPPATLPAWVSYIPYILFFAVILFFGFFLVNQMNAANGGGRAMNFARAKLKVGDSGKKKIRFSDVAGADEEKEELKEIVEFLKNPKQFTDLGARIPRGILMVGPPGTGKTYMAKATAGEADVPFFSISGSDFVELYVGVGASRVRDTFDQAKKNAPCIVFIDEIDAVGRQRGAGLGGGNDEREQTLNQLLVEMDGFEENEGVIVIAATNRPDVLDSALLRPGRFDRQIVIHLPDVKAREEILKIHAKNKPLKDDVKLDNVAKLTAGFAPADLENLLNEAALLTARQGADHIGMAEITDAIMKVSLGVEKKSRIISDKEKKLTAYHEAGHAIVTTTLNGNEEVSEVSIIPRGMAGGYTAYLPKENKSYMSKNEMLERIASALGGRAAEELCLDDISTGASSDIEQATDIARKMVTRYGMSEELGTILFGSGHDEVFLGRDFTSEQKNYSEQTAAAIDREIKHIIDTQYQRARQILTDSLSKLHQIAQLLLEKEKLTGEEFSAIMAQ